ncbi:MAG: SUMF1/EgtB/PvdO family nonheme iron enzyme [Candidatus Eremiobacteraeota bacterium]|nr:SUMF1/EgtB/PvdO family nonheme iron enzyme [Candidatus Eremiobacteraeota bacterium]MCW5872530.1 SUMF1/EgtB/PvdO family nonheme iron enzyme [Candidatus Eremiobacteraeota bacterium]
MLAILTADMEGFSGRMRADEQAVITLLLSTYYRLARQAAHEFEGELYRREGDAVWCSFADPQKGVEAALWLLARLALYNRDQPEDRQVRLRAGLAWGEVTLAGSPAEPFGPTVDLAKRLETSGRTGCLHCPAELAEERPLVEPASERSLPGHAPLRTALLMPSAALLSRLGEEMAESFGSWVFVVDLLLTSEEARQEWLAWAVESREQGLAQVLEWKEHTHLLLWTGTVAQEPPFVMPAGARVSATFGTVVVHSGVGEEGLNWSGRALEEAMDLLERAPQTAGLWGTAPLRYEREGDGYGYRGEVGLAEAAPEAGVPEACILCGPLLSPEQWEALPHQEAAQWWDHPAGLPVPDPAVAGLVSQLDCPLFDWTNLAGSEAAFRHLHPDQQALLRRGRLLWLGPPGSAETLKLLYADFEYRFQNSRPGTLIHWDWPERELKRWSRRGFELVAWSPEYFQELVQRFRFLRQQRREEHRLSLLPARPYKFLNYYTREDRAIFFGREADCERLHSRLLASSVLVVFGKSGVGKTSLLRAGLLSRFQAPQDLVVTQRMLSEPVAAVRQLLGKVLGLSVQDESLASLLVRAEQCVRGAVVVVLDQFEEFFLRCTPGQRAQFGRELAEVLRLDLRRSHLILSLREDFLAQMAELEEFVPTILQQRFRVTALDRAQTKEAILKPAQLFHLEIESALVEELLGLGGIEPPQLQIILDRLYEHRQGQRIGWDTYQALGGAERILRGYFEETLRHNLGPERQRARHLLKAMVTEQKTKLVTTLEELDARLGWPRENLMAVLKLLVESRLVRSWEEGERGCYELAHDFLTQEIAAWETPEEVAAKHAQAVLSNEMRNYSKLGLIVPKDRLLLLEPQKSALVLGPSEQAMLVRSSVLQGLDPAPWLGHETGVLLRVLDEDISGEVARHVIRVLCGLPLEDRALERMLQAARQVGNPHLLTCLEAGSPLRQALAEAVHERFFGPLRMARVPAGPAWIGSTRENKESRKARLRPDLHERIESEADYHRVELDEFLVDLRLVSNADYCEFRPMHVHFFPPEEAELPAVNVSCEEAGEYARWLGKRLPSEEQWEKAARGPDGRLFPWGDEWDGERVNSAESGRRFLTPVDAFPAGASPYGCLNMAGNVWEWTTTPWEPDSPLMAKKGGCALNFEPHMQCSARFEDPPEMRLRWAGFRLISRA